MKLNHFTLSIDNVLINQYFAKSKMYKPLFFFLLCTLTIVDVTFPNWTKCEV